MTPTREELIAFVRGEHEACLVEVQRVTAQRANTDPQEYPFTFQCYTDELEKYERKPAYFAAIAADLEAHGRLLERLNVVLELVASDAVMDERDHEDRFEAGMTAEAESIKHSLEVVLAEEGRTR